MMTDQQIIDTLYGTDNWNIDGMPQCDVILIMESSGFERCPICNVWLEQNEIVYDEKYMAISCIDCSKDVDTTPPHNP